MHDQTMFKTIIKFFYSIFIFIFIASILFASWTAYSFISQPSKSDEILKVIKKMYGSQKSVIFDFVDLTSILIKEKDSSEDYKIIYPATKKDLPKVAEDNSPGIGIEPSQNVISEGVVLPGNIEEPIVNEDNSLGIGMELSQNESSEDVVLPGNIEEPLINEAIESSIHLDRWNGD